MILGITGGVGSGKSTVLRYLENKHNAYIIEADVVAKEIMEPGHEVYYKVLDAFSESILNEDSKINNSELASIVFNDCGKLKLLNSIVHPGVKTEIKKRIADIKSKDNNALVVIEAALLIEDGYRVICDQIWYVYCEKEERIQRLMTSRGYSMEKALEIMKNQLTEEEFKMNTDAFVDNTLSEANTGIQVDELLRKVGY